MSLIPSAAQRIYDRSNGLLGRDELEPVRPLLPPPAPAGIMGPPLPDDEPDAPAQRGASVFQRLYGGGDFDPSLSREDNERIARQSMLITGLQILSDPRGGLPAIANGLAAGFGMRQQMEGEARTEMQEQAIKAHQSRVLEIVGGDPDVSTLRAEVLRSAQLGDEASMQMLAPMLATAQEIAFTREQERLQDAANDLEIEYFRNVNTDPDARGVAIDELEARAEEGDQAATLALRRIQEDSTERENRRQRIADTFARDGEELNHRARAFRNVLATPNASDLEIINNFLAIETGDPSASARTVAQYAEQTAVMPFLQKIKDFAEGRTSELDKDIKAQMLGQIRAKEVQFRREAARYDERLTRRSTAARIEKSSIMPESPTDILRDIDTFRAQSQGQRPQPTIDPGDGGDPIPLNSQTAPVLSRY